MYQFGSQNLYTRRILPCRIPYLLWRVPAGLSPAMWFSSFLTWATRYTPPFAAPKKEENTAFSGHARAMAQQIDIIQGQLPCTWLIWSSNERLFVQLSIMLHCPSSSKTPSVMAKRRWLDQLWKGPIMCWMQSRNAKQSKLSCWHHPWQLFLATMPMWWKQSKRHCLLSISTQHAQWNTMFIPMQKLLLKRRPGSCMKRSHSPHTGNWWPSTLGSSWVRLCLQPLNLGAFLYLTSSLAASCLGVPDAEN